MPTFEELFPEYAGAPPSRPFEPIRPRALDAPMSRARRTAIDVTGLGGAQEAGPLLWPWTIVYLALLATAARLAFARRDL